MNKHEKMKRVTEFLKKTYPKGMVHFPARNKFMLLVGTILSQRTRDENTAKAVENLFSMAKNPEEISTVNYLCLIII